MDVRFRRLVTAALVAGLVAVPAAVGRADTVYVVSFVSGSGTLVRYDSANPTFSLTTLVAASSQLNSAAGLAAGPDGNLYIGVNGGPPSQNPTVAPTIVRYDVSSGTLSTVHTFSDFSVFPGSLAFRGNDLLVGRNPFYGNTGAIVRLTNVTGGSVTASAYTTGGSLASSPGLALAADGSLYVSDQTYDFQTGVATGPVKRFDASGAYVGEVIASGTNGLAGPTGLAIRGTTLYTASIMPGTVLQTNLSTDATQPFGNSGQPFGTGPLALLSAGSLLAGDPSGLNPSEIYRFDAQGTLIDSYSLGLGPIGGLATVAVPEPGTLVLAGLGLAAGAMLVRRHSLRRRSP